MVPRVYNHYLGCLPQPPALQVRREPTTPVCVASCFQVRSKVSCPNPGAPMTALQITDPLRWMRSFLSSLVRQHSPIHMEAINQENSSPTDLALSTTNVGRNDRRKQICSVVTLTLWPLPRRSLVSGVTLMLVLIMALVILNVLRLQHLSKRSKLELQHQDDGK